MLFITLDTDKCGMSHMMFDVTLFDALGRHFGFLFDVGNVKGIHFCPETNKLLRRDRVGFVFKLSDDFCVGGTVQRVGFGICTGVVMLEVTCHVLIQIFRLNLVAEAVRVGKQKPCPICAVLTMYMFVVKFVHEDFGQLQYLSLIHI